MTGAPERVAHHGISAPGFTAGNHPISTRLYMLARARRVSVAGFPSSFANRSGI
jgi:hypothetical protein